MKLTASPFDPQTGELLDVYRDAYLRGDLSKASARAVEEYLRRDANQAHDTLTRWHQIQDEAQEAAPSWVSRQIQHIKAEPVRFRRRAASIVTVAAMLGGAVFAGTNLPSTNLPTNLPTSETAEMLVAPTAEAASAIRMVTVKGRILGHDGKPLIGATVLQKGTRFGVSTDANGAYSMRVPAGQEQTLVYGYGGYNDQELQVQNTASADVTLTPRSKQRRWFLF